LLQDQGSPVQVIEYLKTPPDEATLRQILDMLGLRPIELVREKESIFDELNLAQHRQDDPLVIQAMLNHPQLIERPIVIHNGKAIIGRPPEKVLDIL
jgi:arsenate reductase